MRNIIVYDNGEQLEIPEILSSGAGWILRPDEARTDDEIRSGKNKSFGRSYEGREKAKAWLVDYLTTWQNDNGWPTPVSHNRTNHSRTIGIGRGGMSIGFKDPVYLYHAIDCSARERSRYEDEYSVSYEWRTINLFAWTHHKEIIPATVEPFGEFKVTSAKKTFKTKDQMLVEVESFAKDPIKQFEKHNHVSGIEFPVRNSELPPFEWPNGTFEWADDAETIQLWCNDNHTFYRDRNFAEKVFVESGDIIHKLSKALSHLGVDFRIDTRYDYMDVAETERAPRLWGFTVRVPGDKSDPHNHLGHQIRVDANGVSVECGYYQDELKYQEYQKRQAADWLTEMMEETSTPTYEDYEYDPGN